MAPANAERRVATSQELLQAALQRSAQHNATVAQRRLRWRWAGWALWRLLGLTALALALWAWSVWPGVPATLRPPWARSPAPTQAQSARLKASASMTAAAQAAAATSAAPAPASTPPSQERP